MASLCNRKATGIEINQHWVDIYHKVCKREKIEKQEVICGDCLEILPKLKDQGRIFDFVTTDPPYSIALEKTMCDDVYDIQHRKTDFYGFSKDPRDFRNLQTFEEYYDAMEKAGRLVYDVLRDKGYFVLIIRDSYQNGQYVMASYEIAERMKRAGFRLKGIKIWYATGARVRPYGYPFVYVPNIINQNIVILRKEENLD